MGYKVLKETDDEFTIYNPETKSEENHPKVPGAWNRLMEGVKGQSNSGDIQNQYMANLDKIRKQKGWLK